MRFTYFPAFPDMIRYNTKKLWVRNIPRLDMSTMDIDEWPNLLEINLKGKLKSTLHILYFFSFYTIFSKNYVSPQGKSEHISPIMKK